MPIINISVRNKISKYLGNEPIVCKNSDYVLHFDLDEQWSPFAVKTVKIAYGESFIPVVFNGNECAMPKLPNTTLVGISLEAGDVRTAVPAWIECLPVLEDDVSEVPPPPENVYNQIMEMISSGVLTGARIVETVYMGTDANGGNVYKQIFDNGMESTFVAPKGIDAKFVLGEDNGTAYEGSKGAQNRRDISRLYELAEGLSDEIAENAENIADVNEALSKSKPTKPETFKPHNFVSYDVAGNKLTDTGYSGADIAENKENIRKNSSEITKNANNIQRNATDISGIKVNFNKMSTDIAQNEIDISTLRVFANELSARLNAVANSTDVDLDQLSEIVAYIKSNKSLIDNITTNKVNVSDIVDNLTTEAKNKPLSAKQGVALKALIDELAYNLSTELDAIQTEWDYVLIDSSTISADLQSLSGNVLVKGGSHFGEFFNIGENVKHLHFDGTSLRSSTTQVIIKGHCEKISGINTDFFIEIGDGVTNEVENCEFGGCRLVNTEVNNVYVNHSTRTKTVAFRICSHMNNIKIADGKTPTYTDCKYVNPFTCQGFGNGVPMIDKNGAVTFVESAEGGSYGS